MKACGLMQSTIAACAIALLFGTAACGPTRPIVEVSPTLATTSERDARPAYPVEARHIKETRIAADAYFAFGSTELSEEGKAKLDELAAQVPGKQDPRIQITGYTDRVGDDRYNMELALRRAEAVEDYLIARGVDEEFIDVSALGAHDPIVACAGRQGSQLIRCLAPNRRTVVEFSAFEVLDDAAPAVVGTEQ